MVGKVNLQMVLEAVDKASPALNTIAETMGKVINVGGKQITLGQQLQEVGHKARTAATELGALALKLGAVGGITAVAFKKGFLDIGAEFERLETVLTTLEGSQAKAKQSLGWIQEFATKTPYEMGEVTEAFVRLRSYGMDPTNGTLATLGDTAAAMGKPMMAAVEMMADAVNGENERLKEFGIKASVDGQKIAYSYFNKQGEEMVRVVNKNRTEIRNALTEIFSSKYTGGMEALSHTWNGMISNLKDAWTNFAVAVMQSGVMDVLQQELGSLLTWVKQLTAEGKNSAVVVQTAQLIIEKLHQAKAVLQVVWPVVVQIATAANNVANALGGWGNVINIALILMSLNAITAIVGLVFSIIAPLLTIAGILATGAAVLGTIMFFMTQLNAGGGVLKATLTTMSYVVKGMVGPWISLARVIGSVVPVLFRIASFMLRYSGWIGLTVGLLIWAASEIVKNWDVVVALYDVYLRDAVEAVVKAIKSLGNSAKKALADMANDPNGKLLIKFLEDVTYHLTLIDRLSAAFKQDLFNKQIEKNFTRDVNKDGRPFAKNYVPESSLIENTFKSTYLGGKNPLVSNAGGSQKLHIKLDVENNKIALVGNNSTGQPMPTKLDMGFLRA